MVIVYPSLGKSYSMERYASGLLEELREAGIPSRPAITKQYDSRLKRLLQKYLLYPLRCLILRDKGQHIIISERFAYLALFLPKKKTTVVLHDLHTLCPEEGVGSLHIGLYKAMIRIMVNRSSVVTVSQYTAGELKRFFPQFESLPIQVAHNGVEQFWFEASQSKDEPSTPSPYVLMVGTDTWYKNFSFVIHLVAQFPKGLKLVKVGAISPDNQRLIVEKGLQERIIQEQGLNDAALKKLYENAFCLLFPSLSEGFGWPAVEAMACGCPVVTSGTGSISEVCSDAAIYAKTEEDYLQAIESLTDTKTRQKYIEKGKARASVFTWSNTINALLK